MDPALTQESDMPRRSLVVIANLLVALTGCLALGPQAQSAAVAGYLPPQVVNLAQLLPPPPKAGSAQERAELDELLQIQATRTAAQVERARADATLSIFRFADALGNPAAFSPQHLPLTTALFQRIGVDEDRFVEPAKNAFARPRPYVTEKRLSPMVPEPWSASYPSGHTTWAVACAIVLADMLPEKRAQIFARAAEFGHNREVGGVHYPSDVAAGHLAGTVYAQELFLSPRFVADEAAASAELRQALKLPPLPSATAPRH
jgi:acid phosphatase (class A)